jgi:hypothetical protein
LFAWLSVLLIKKVGVQRSKVKGQRSKVKGQRSKVKGQRSKVKGQRSKAQRFKSSKCIWIEKFKIRKVQFLRDSRFHSRFRTAFGIRIYEKSVSFVRLNPKFEAKWSIIWGNEQFLRELPVFDAFFVLNPEH